MKIVKDKTLKIPFELPSFVFRSEATRAVYYWDGSPFVIVVKPAKNRPLGMKSDVFNTGELKKVFKSKAKEFYVGEAKYTVLKDYFQKTKKQAMIKEKESRAKIKISHQGAVVVNRAFVCEASQKLLALEIDLHSKYCELLGDGEDNNIPNIMVGANKRSLHLDKTKPKDEPTVIDFPGLKGWDIFASETSKYTVRVCLIKKKI